MSYQALYRKFRPAGFEDVKGQEHIVTTLKNQIKADRVGHAYLFCGTRGTGKTTIAKILAKAVNCQHPQDGSPCNECSICRAINSQVSMNVVEIDAASNNGVDNIREIVDEVQYSPTEGKYKVYIIDEVHMLSTGAFNALLKTLEEPPSYVIFILATTEVHKIPITILSRCQRYDFRRITIDTIAERLNELLTKEGVEAEEKAVRYVAKAADGSMRDGLSLLDQCIAFYLGEKLTYDKVLDVLGAVDHEIFGKLFGHLIGNEVVPAIELLEEMVEQGRDLGQFVIDFTWYMRNLLLLQSSVQAEDMIDASTEALAALKSAAGLADTDVLMRYIRILSQLSNQIRYASQKRVLIEIALIKLCRPQMETNYDSLLDRLRQVEEKLEKGVVAVGSMDSKAQPGLLPTAVQQEDREEKDTKDLEALSAALPEELKEIARNWPAVMGMLPPAVRSMMTTVRPSVGEGNKLLLLCSDELERKYIETEEHIADIRSAIQKRIEKEVEITVQYVEEGNLAKDSFPDLTKLIKMDIEYED